MCRICRIFVRFSNQQTKAARSCVLKLSSLKLLPGDVKVIPASVDQEELCVELRMPDAKTDDETEQAVINIWNHDIKGALKRFEYEHIQITI